MTRKPAPDARALALQILREVLGGRGFASERLDALLERRRLGAADRGLCTQLVYGVLREKGFLDRVVSEYVSAAKTPSGLRHLLRLAAYQALCLDKVPDHAVVHESVELAKRLFGAPPARMVNAVLRKVIADRQKHLEDRRDPAGAFPEWMLERWRRRYPTATLEALLAYFQDLPPVGLRVNLNSSDPEKVAGRLREAGLEVGRIPETPLLTLRGLDRERLAPLLRAGEISVQDPHSYRVAEAVAARPGETGLDACAGHGGKSAAILEACPDLQLWVHEPAAARLQELKANFRRLGLKAPRVLASAAEGARRGLSFDWILVDAPCSGMGTLGRKPEIRWRLQPKDLARLAVGQRAILEEWWPRLKPGGRLIYAVCSLEPEEGADLIRAFAADHPEVEPGAMREWRPDGDPGDGFFVANLRRRT
ncbi:MAG: 16S rRNA (cytosine(967)-C(5))-methyltransferase RsmB [Deltaproteobacteria bacterium]|nr:16S rRNA (cytosine(967)-C(5))-methyltransferase RsmB [Deltaproteobacteria bacterium]